MGKRGSTPEEARDFCLLHSVQTGSETATRAVVKNAWSYISTLPYAFVAYFLFKHRDYFTFI
jgi:hypothetical protein